MQREPKKHKKSLVIVPVVVLIVAAVFCALYAAGILRFGGEPSAQRDLTAKLGVMPNKTQEEMERVLNQLVDEGRFNIAINSNMTCENGTLNVGIENIPGNRYLMQVDLKLADTGEMIYSSGTIEPGYYIDEGKCEKQLSPGEYKAVAVFTAIDEQTDEHMGQSEIEVKITVQ